MKRPKVIRVTATEYETDDGRIFPHPAPLDPVPTVDEFQVHCDRMFDIFRDQGFVKEDGEAGNHTSSR